MNTRNGSALGRLVGIPTASGLASRLAVAHLQRRGQNSDGLLMQAGISAAALLAGSRIPAANQIDFLDLVSGAIADDWIGLTLAADVDLREMGMLYYVAASCPRFGDALDSLERYARVGNEALVLRVRKSSVCRIELSYAGVARHRDRHQMELLALAFLRLSRQLLGRNVMPIKATFAHNRAGDLREARRHFGDGVEFGAAADQMSLDATLLDVPLVNADPFLHDLMLDSCEESLARRPLGPSPLRTRVENAIAPLLPHGKANARTVARRLGLSERTFSRRLKSEGVTFAEVLDELRREMALPLLVARSLPISQIAWLLGFSGASSFSHACRRWTGDSPSGFRRAAA